MSALRIGKVGRTNFTLPVDVAGEAIAVLAKRGAGKSNTAVVIAEELLDHGVQVVILDPVGAHWGIRYGADGKTAGCPIPILGGQHGDVPLEATAGKLIADVVVDSGSSALIDLSDFETKADANRFVTDFAKRLYWRKSRNPSTVHLVLEEADQFCPQKVGKAETHMVSAFERLVRLGRARGIGISMVTQRSASLNKHILTQADTLVAMRTTGPQDRAAVRLWVDAKGDDSKEVLDSLPGLQTGEAWFWNPEHGLLDRVQVRLCSTYDSRRTPKPGETREAPTAAAEIDLTALGEQIASTREKAEANDPAVLQRRIATLERALRNAQAAGVADEAAIERAREEGRAEAAGVIETHAERALRLRNGIESRYRELESLQNELGRALERMDDLLGVAAAAIETPRPPDYPTAAPTFAPSPLPCSAVPAVVPSIAPRHVAILEALAKLEAIGLDSARREVVAFLAGKSHTSGGYRNDVSRLNTEALIHYPAPGELALTEAGRAIVPGVHIPTLAELHDQVRSILAPRHWDLLAQLIHHHPGTLSREHLADLVGKSATSGGYRNDISRLKSLGLIDYPVTGEVRASSLLFPAGLR